MSTTKHYYNTNMTKYTIEFKEVCMDAPVVREAVASSFNKVIDFYGLNQGDIEYWKILNKEEV